MADQDEGMTIHMDGKTYKLEDFELGDLEWLEEELGGLDEDHVNSMKATVRFVYLIRRRDNPQFTLDDARKIKVSVLNEAVESVNGNGKQARPTRAKSKDASSIPAESGATS